MGSGYTPKRSGVDAVAKVIRDLRSSVADLNRRISGLGIQVDKANGKLIIAAGRSLEVDGSETVGGSLNVTGPATFGGNTSIGGNLAVTGTLSLPNGIIDNDALAAPVTAAVLNAANSGLTIGTSWSSLATASATVPSGFSRALVHATAEVGASAPTGGGNLNGYLDINGSAGNTISTAAVESGAPTSIPCGYARLLSGLTGGSSTVTVTVHGSASSAGWGGGNGHIAASILYLR